MAPTTPSQIEQDLQYIRTAVECRYRRGSMPMEIALLWGLLVLIGFPLADFAPGIVPIYWMIACPGGMILQYWLLARRIKRHGEQDRLALKSYVSGSVGLFVALGLSSLLVIKGVIGLKGIQEVTILLLGLFYFLIGVGAKNRTMIWLAGMWAGAYLAFLFIDRYVWTVFGVVFAVVLIGGALVERTQHATEA